MALQGINAALGFIRIDIDPVIHIGSVPVHWYGVMYALAFLVGFRDGVLPHVTRRGVAPGTPGRAPGGAIIFGLLGARLYYVVQQPNLGDYLHDPIRIIAVWEGGMAFFGAILAGLAAVTVFAWRNRISAWLMWDSAVIFAVIGQPIGRIGNVINGDILGARSDLPWATAYANPHAVLQSGFRLCTSASCVAYQPAAVYEALGTIAIGLVLFARRRRAGLPPPPGGGVWAARAHRHRPGAVRAAPAWRAQWRTRRRLYPAVRDQPADPVPVPSQRARARAGSPPGPMDGDGHPRGGGAGRVPGVALGGGHGAGHGRRGRPRRAARRGRGSCRWCGEARQADPTPRGRGPAAAMDNLAVTSAEHTAALQA